MFNVVGAGGFVVQIGTIALLTRHFGWPAFVATAVALELAALQNFLAHSRWTWGDRPVPSNVEGVAPSGVEGPEINLRGWPRRYWRYHSLSSNHR